MCLPLLAAAIAGAVGFLLLFIIIILGFLFKLVRKKGNYIQQNGASKGHDYIFIIFIFYTNLKYKMIMTNICQNLYQEVFV